MYSGYILIVCKDTNFSISDLVRECAEGIQVACDLSKGGGPHSFLWGKIAERRNTGRKGDPSALARYGGVNKQLNRRTENRFWPYPGRQGFPNGVLPEG